MKTPKLKALKWKQTWQLHAMILPGIVFVLLFAYMPMVGITIAFQDFNPTKGFFGSDWLGFDNFKYMFELPDTFRILRNTVIIAALKIFFGFLAPILFALLLNEIKLKWWKRGIQTFVYFPHFVSWVIMGGILVNILALKTGAVNQLLGAINIDPIFFLGEPGWFRVTLIVTDVLKEFGFGAIIYLAALSGISPDLYEAAIIDGAGRFKQTWHVTLPGIMHVAVLLGILSIGNILNAGFDQIFNLYNYLVLDSSEIIDTWVYSMGLLQAQYGLATAVGLLKSVIAFLLIAGSYRLAVKLANYRIF